MKKSIAFLVVLFALICCTKKEHPTELDLNGFNSFYDQFHKDSTFQLEHIRFPLAGKVRDSIKGFWYEEDWKLHSLDHFDTSLFDHSIFTADSLFVIERFDHKKYPYSVERRFVKLDTEWNLIYYFAP